MLKAVMEVIEDGKTIRKTAKDYGLSRKCTLQVRWEI